MAYLLPPRLVSFKDGTMDHNQYIKEVLPVTLKFGNDMFGTDWTFQQDSAKSHIHAKSQEWYGKHFSLFHRQGPLPPPPPEES